MKNLTILALAILTTAGAFAASSPGPIEAEFYKREQAIADAEMKAQVQIAYHKIRAMGLTPVAFEVSEGLAASIFVQTKEGKVCQYSLGAVSGISGTAGDLTCR